MTERTLPKILVLMMKQKLQGMWNTWGSNRARFEFRDQRTSDKVVVRLLLWLVVKEGNESIWRRGGEHFENQASESRQGKRGRDPFDGDEARST